MMHDWMKLGKLGILDKFLKEIPTIEWPEHVKTLPTKKVFKNFEITYREWIIKELQNELNHRKHLDDTLSRVDLRSELGE